VDKDGDDNSLPVQASMVNTYSVLEQNKCNNKMLPADRSIDTTIGAHLLELVSSVLDQESVFYLVSAAVAFFTPVPYTSRTTYTARRASDTDSIRGATGGRPRNNCEG